MAQEGTDAVLDERFILAFEKYITSVTKETNVTRKAQELAKRPTEELRQLTLTRLLTPEAKEKLGQYALLKPNKARLMEEAVLKRAEKGLTISEVKSVNKTLASVLEKIITKVTKETKVTRKAQELAKRPTEELRQLTLTRLLTPEAKEKLGQYALLKPNKARLMEEAVLKRVEKCLTISEVKSVNKTLASVLEKIITKVTKETKVTGNRLTPEQRKAPAKRRAEELRQLNLTRIMTPEAKERLARMAVKHPIKTRMVEDLILKYAAEKGVRIKVPDESLIALLEAMETRAAASKLRSKLEAMHI